MATNRQSRKAARVPNEAVEIPASDANSGSDEEEEEDSLTVGAAASDDEDEDEDDEEGEVWETESFFRDALGDGSAPVVFEPRKWAQVASREISELMVGANRRGRVFGRGGGRP